MKPGGTGPPGGPWKTVDGVAAAGFGVGVVAGVVVGSGSTAVVGTGGRLVIRRLLCLPPRRARGTAMAAISTTAASGTATRLTRRARRRPATLS
jgi:hypothetical protein